MPERFTIESPVGLITIETDDERVSALTIADPSATASAGSPPNPVLARTRDQLREYFAGERRHFDVPLEIKGTAFQEKVWRALEDIPFGQTTSYQELAERVGAQKAARAVGGAVGANPIPIVIPCHRVLSSQSALTGYSAGGGIETKKRLLDLEGISYR